jgi:hypothetical protein
VLAGLPAQNIPSTALLLNIGVTGTSLLRYGLAGRVKAGILLPFLVPAVPAAFVGGLCRTSHRVFFVVLAVALLVAAAATFRSSKQTDKGLREGRLSTRLAVGIPCSTTSEILRVARRFFQRSCHEASGFRLQASGYSAGTCVETQQSSRSSPWQRIWSSLFSARPLVFRPRRASGCKHDPVGSRLGPDERT